MSDVTGILSQIQQGDPQAAEKLLPLVYDELRKLAAARLAQEKPGQTLEATALVHEAYVRLVGGHGTSSPGPLASEGKEQIRDPRSEENRPTSDLRQRTSKHWDGRGHFFAAAATAMRRILIENARRKGRLKHGGKHERAELDPDGIASPVPTVDLLALDEALSRLAQSEPIKAELVKLRYFAGLTMPEAAAALEISLATAERYWTFARSWLYAELSDEP